jgi:hypothetical protein
MHTIRKPLGLICLMLFAPVLLAQPYCSDAPHLVVSSDNAPSVFNQVAWNAPATPFVITVGDVDHPKLSLHSGTSFHQAAFAALATDAGDDSDKDHFAFNPDHPADYGGI